MNTKKMKNAMALGAGGALIAGAVLIDTASPSWAAPVISNTATVRTAASNQVTNVHYYRRGYYRHGYYGRGYYPGRYGYPWWGDPYAYYYRSYYSYYYPAYYPYYYPYSYPYTYSFPFAFGFGWGGLGW